MDIDTNISPKVSGHSSLLVHEDHMVIIGGWSDGGCTENSYTYNFVNKEWNKLETDGSFEKRDSCRAVFCDNKIYAWAGWNGFSRLDSLNVLDLRYHFLSGKWNPSTHSFFPSHFRDLVFFLFLIHKSKLSPFFHIPKVLLRHLIKFLW